MGGSTGGGNGGSSAPGGFNYSDDFGDAQTKEKPSGDSKPLISEVSKETSTPGTPANAADYGRITSPHAVRDITYTVKGPDGQPQTLTAKEFPEGKRVMALGQDNNLYEVRKESNGERNLVPVDKQTREATGQPLSVVAQETGIHNKPAAASYETGPKSEVNQIKQTHEGERRFGSQQDQPAAQLRDKVQPQAPSQADSTSNKVQFDRQQEKLFPQIDPGSAVQRKEESVKIEHADRSPISSSTGPELRLKSGAQEGTELARKVPQDVGAGHGSSLNDHATGDKLANKSDSVKAENLFQQTNEGKNRNIDVLDHAKSAVRADVNDLNERAGKQTSKGLSSRHGDVIEQLSDKLDGTKGRIDLKDLGLLAAMKQDSAGRPPRGGGGGANVAEVDGGKNGRRTPDKSAGDGKSGGGIGGGSDRSGRTGKTESDHLAAPLSKELKETISGLSREQKAYLVDLIKSFQIKPDAKFDSKDQPVIEKVRQLKPEELTTLTNWASGKKNNLETHSTVELQNKWQGIFDKLLENPFAQMRQLVKDLSSLEVKKALSVVEQIIKAPQKRFPDTVDQIIAAQLKPLDKNEQLVIKKCMEDGNSELAEKSTDKVKTSLSTILLIVKNFQVAENANTPIWPEPTGARKTEAMDERRLPAERIKEPSTPERNIASIQASKEMPPEDQEEKVKAYRKSRDKDKRTKTRQIKEKDSSPELPENTVVVQDLEEEEEEKKENQEHENIKLLKITEFEKVFLDEKVNNTVRITKEGSLEEDFSKRLELWCPVRKEWLTVALYQLRQKMGTRKLFKRSGRCETSTIALEEPALSNLLNNDFERFWHKYVRQFEE